MNAQDNILTYHTYSFCINIDARTNTYIAKCLVDMHAFHSLLFCITNGSWINIKTVFV